MATQPDYPLMTAAEFLEIDFGDRKAELDNGVIRMMAGGTARHSDVQGNIYVALRQKLRGSECRPYNSDMAAETRASSIRCPDVAVYCGRSRPEYDDKKAFNDPRVIFEVLSAGTARTDLRTKLEEYREIPSIDTIIFVDIAIDRVRIVQRTAAHGWNNVAHDDPADVPMPSLGIAISHDEIFARD